MMLKSALGVRGCVWRWALAVVFVLCPAPAFALIIALSFESVANSVPLTGAGTTTATLNFGHVSAFGALASGVSRTVGASSYTISTNFGIRVTRIISLSPNYTLQARLQGAHPLTWRLDGVTLTSAATTISTSQPFGQIVPHSLAFVVPFTHPSGGVTTVLEVTAIGN